MAFDMNSLIKSTTISPPKVIVYGQPGIGKTSLAAGAGAVLVDCENGAGAIAGLIRTPYLESWPAIRDAIQAFLALDPGSLPPAIAIDTGDWLIRRIVEYVCVDLDDKKPGDVTNTLGGAHGSFFKAREIVENIISRDLFPMLNLLTSRGCVIILLAHASNEKITTPEGGEMKMAIPDFPAKGILPLFLEWADAVLYAKKDQATGERVVITEGDYLITAKNRYSLPSVLPLAWDQIIAAMTKTNTQEEG